jgi:hypothetical protein
MKPSLDREFGSGYSDSMLLQKLDQVAVLLTPDGLGLEAPNSVHKCLTEATSVQLGPYEAAVWEQALATAGENRSDIGLSRISLLLSPLGSGC